MAIRTYSGRVADAIAFSRRPVHVAWGSGETTWHETYSEPHLFDANNTFKVDHTPVAAFELRGPDNQLYKPDSDYYVVAVTGMVVRPITGSTIPDGVELTAIYKTSAPDLTGLETGLASEIGRRRAQSIQFIVPDPEGPIDDAFKQRWAVSAEPTNTLLISVKFGYDEAPDAIIQEFGIFVDTVARPEIPPGQDYLTPDQIEHPGYLHTIEHVTPVIRSATKRDGADIFIEF